jgi:integrase
MRSDSTCLDIARPPKFPPLLRLGRIGGHVATNLHALGVDDKTIQAILRHSNVNLTMNVYVKSVSESQVSAMDALEEKTRNSQRPCNTCEGSD